MLKILRSEPWASYPKYDKWKKGQSESIDSRESSARRLRLMERSLCVGKGSKEKVVLPKEMEATIWIKDQVGRIMDEIGLSFMCGLWERW